MVTERTVSDMELLELVYEWYRWLFTDNKFLKKLLRTKRR